MPVALSTEDLNRLNRLAVEMSVTERRKQLINEAALLRGQLLIYLRSRLPCSDDAEDVLHEVFIKLQHTEHLPAETKLKSWLYTALRNAVSDFYRRKKYYEPFNENTTTAIYHSPEEDVSLNSCLADWLSRLIRTLPVKYRDVMTAVEIDRVSQKDYATDNTLPYATVKSLVQRGRKKLRHRFLSCCHIDFSDPVQPSLEKKDDLCC